MAQPNPPAPTPPVQQRISRFLGRDVILLLSGFFSGSLITALGVLLGGWK